MRAQRASWGDTNISASYDLEGANGAEDGPNAPDLDLGRCRGADSSTLSPGKKSEKSSLASSDIMPYRNFEKWSESSGIQLSH